MKSVLISIIAFCVSATALAGFSPRLCGVNTLESRSKFSISTIQYGNFTDGRGRAQEAFFVRYRDGASKMYLVIQKETKKNFIAFQLKDTGGEVSLIPEYFYAELNPNGSYKDFFGTGQEHFQLKALAQACH